MIEVNKKYKVSNLYKIRKFYDIFSNEKLYPLGTKLSWSHYRELLIVKDFNEIIYYINICEKNNLSKRQLHERIKSHEYDRLSDETKLKLINEVQLKVDDLIPNPVIIKTDSPKEELSEYALKHRYNYSDFLLYNIKFKCYVVVELKVTELKKEHTGQIMTYMNYIDNYLKTIEENDTVGIIICKHDNKYVIEYCSDKRIIAREYELIH